MLLSTNLVFCSTKKEKNLYIYIFSLLLWEEVEMKDAAGMMTSTPGTAVRRTRDGNSISSTEIEEPLEGV